MALIVCTGIINAYNFMDGINGITGGYSSGCLGCFGVCECGELFSFVEREFDLYDDCVLCWCLISLISVRGRNALPVMWGRSV